MMIDMGTVHQWQGWLFMASYLAIATDPLLQAESVKIMRTGLTMTSDFTALISGEYQSRRNRPNRKRVFAWRSLPR
jgi:hypothetical protein